MLNLLLIHLLHFMVDLLLNRWLKQQGRALNRTTRLFQNHQPLAGARSQHQLCLLCCWPFLQQALYPNFC